ncbi:MAG TPA: hypothetical protein VFH83_09240 [Spirochaetia bacterium]|nr:hypothetical protein [Spirochaetia bacterium]
MKTLSKVLLIIGLVLGCLGGLSRIATVALGDTIMATLRGSGAQLQGNYSVAQKGLEQATAKTFSNIASIAGNLLLVLVGGALGLLACAEDTDRKWKVVFSLVALAAGLGLLAMRSWVCAGAYVIGGCLSLLAVDRPAGPAKDSQKV